MKVQTPWLSSRRTHTKAATQQKNRTRPFRKSVSGVEKPQSRYQKPLAPKSCSVIIPAWNEDKTIGDNVRMLMKWAVVKEVIVVANGCTDKTARRAARAGATVISFDEPVGHDVGRAIGAAHSTGQYLLFLDADILWTRRELRPFIQALESGADLALNRYPLRTSRYFHHPTAIAKRTLNIALGLPGLQASSMTTVPHAMKRRVVNHIGPESLAIPPLAMTKAALAGFRVQAVSHVNVRLRNQWKKTRRNPYSVSELILGDHVEAVAYLLKIRGERGGFPDGIRQRKYVVNDVSDPFEWQAETDSSAVIPAHNEAETLPNVIRMLKRAHVQKIQVIENGSSDKTADVATESGAQVESFSAPLGHDVGRALGVRVLGPSRCTLFLDADFHVSAGDIRPFVQSVLEQEVDVALNDLSTHLPLIKQRDAVSTVKRFLNFALRRKDLGIASLTAVPHALSARAIQTITLEELCVPPKALARAVLSGLTVQPVHYVDVVTRNKRRPAMHARRYGAPMSKLIIGDHLEALEFVIQMRGERAGFVQGRNLEVLKALTPRSCEMPNA